MIGMQTEELNDFKKVLKNGGYSNAIANKIVDYYTHDLT